MVAIIRRLISFSLLTQKTLRGMGGGSCPFPFSDEVGPRTYGDDDTSAETIRHGDAFLPTRLPKYREE